MATSTTVRAWASTHTDENGKPYALAKSRGKLSHAAKAAFNAAHPDDVYSGVMDSVPDNKVTVKTFKIGTNKNGKPYKVPISKTFKVSDARNWLRENTDHKIGARGRLSAELLAEYVSA